MKPRNFPGRKQLRRERAAARLEGRPMPKGEPHVTDVKVRLGAKQRKGG